MRVYQVEIMNPGGHVSDRFFLRAKDIHEALHKAEAQLYETFGLEKGMRVSRIEELGRFIE